MSELNTALVAQFQDNLSSIAEVENKISEAVANFKGQLDTLQKQDAELREAIKTAMRDNAVKKFENDLIAISYTEPTQRVTIDTKRLKAEMPDLWSEYSQTTDVKDSIRITVKAGKK